MTRPGYREFGSELRRTDEIAPTLGTVSRLRNSLDLVKTCWAVLRLDRSLLWLPALSIVSNLVTMVVFGSGVYLTRTHDLGTAWRPSVASYALMFLAYLTMSTITIFFNAALISAANERLSGGDPTIESALAGATARFGKILPWAIVSATVSTILRAVQERAGLLGRLVAGIAGIAWALITFLVLPVIVMEGLSVPAAVRRSKELFTRTWGEQMAGNVAIGLASFLAILLTLPLIVLAVVVPSTVITVVAVIVAVAWFAMVAVVAGAMSAIFQTALYRFAATGETSTGFTPAQLSGAFVPKRSSRSGWSR